IEKQCLSLVARNGDRLAVRAPGQTADASPESAAMLTDDGDQFLRLPGEALGLGNLRRIEVVQRPDNQAAGVPTQRWQLLRADDFVAQDDLDLVLEQLHFHRDQIVLVEHELVGLELQVSAFDLQGLLAGAHYYVSRLPLDDDAVSRKDGLDTGVIDKDADGALGGW